MYNLKKIIITDFKTFRGQQEYVFKQNQSLLIKAFNKDTEGADSNGSGKSNFLKAITFGFLGLFDKTEPLERYINNDAQSATVVILLESEKESILVSRTIFRSKSKGAKFSIEINGEVDETAINEKIGTKILLDKIGINYDDLLNYYIINQSNSNGFLRQSDSEQKAIISRFTNLNSIDEVLIQIKEKIKSLNNDISQAKGDVFLLSEKQDFLNNEINSLQSNYESDLREKIEYKINQIKELKAENKEFNDEIDKLQTYVDSIKTKQTTDQFEQEIAEINQAIKELKSEKKQCLVEMSEIEEMISSINSMMKSFIVCPSCEHSFSLSCELSGDELAENLSQLNQMIGLVKSKIKLLNTDIENNEVSSQQKSGLIEKKKSTDTIIRQNESQIERLNQKKIKSLEKITKLLKEIETLSNSEFDNEVVEIAKKEVDSISEDLNKKLSNIESLESKIKLFRFWEHNIGVAGFKTFLINKVLSSIEGYINMYLKKFNINLVVEIKGYKVLGSGEVREKITIFVEQDGIVEPFSSLSGGQKSRLNICCILALQKLINNSCKSGGLNLLILDETFEGLDVTGQIATMRMLEKCGTTNLVVSHSNSEIPCDKLLIERSDGKSKIC